MNLRGAGVLALLASLPAFAMAGEQTSYSISGSVQLSASGRQRVESGEVVDTLVYFVPANGARSAPPGHFTVYTHDRDFSPGAMAVPLGSTVTFVNQDEVRHNVFSSAPGSAFNLGYQAPGETIDHVFGRAGLVLVSCNVHHSMEFDVMVVPTVYRTHAGSDGSFVLTGVPAGPGTLYFWNPRARLASQPVSVPATGDVRQALVAMQDRVRVELNSEDSP